MSDSKTVLVIGSGFAAFCAAIDLHARGWKVEQLSLGSGATSLSSGAWDIAPLSPAHTLNIRDTYRHNSVPTLKDLFLDWKDVPSDDSFARSFAAPQKALSGELAISINEEQPYLLTCSSGKLRSVFAAQEIQAKLNLKSAEKQLIGVVGDPHWAYPARHLCARWNEQAESLGIASRFVSVDIVFSEKLQTLESISLAMENTEHRQQLIDAIRLVRDECDVLLLPPLATDGKWSQEVEKAVGKPVAEPLCSRETAAGMRLQRAMHASLEKLGVRRITADQCRLRWEGAQVVAVEYHDTNRQPHRASASQYVLATGRFLSRGFSAVGQKWEASVSGLPLFSALGNIWNAPVPPLEGYQKLGLSLDDQFRPQTFLPECATNLRATGSCIGGVDVGKRKLGLGMMALLGRECAKKVAAI